MQPAPGVEVPVDAASAAAAVEDERRPDVAHPRVVACQLEHAHRPRQHRAGALELRGGCRHRDRLGGRDRGGDGGERVLRGRGVQAPVVRALGPRHPAARVRLPLGRHVEAVGGGRRGQRLAHGATTVHSLRVAQPIQLITSYGAPGVAGAHPPRAPRSCFGSRRCRSAGTRIPRSTARRSPPRSGAPPTRAPSWCACRS